MSKVSVGRKYENLVKAIYIRNGWLVDKKVRTRFASPDFFGMFDLLCIKGEWVDFVQVKKNKGDYSAAKREIKKWCIENEINCRGIFIYGYRGTEKRIRSWKIAELINNEWSEIVVQEDAL